MQIPNTFMKADFVTVSDGYGINGVPHVKLDIGEGTGSRHAYLTLSEARQIAYALLYQAEQNSPKP